ncbi:pentatricopeptide repeat-containing protein At4g21065 [Andrographis paniculata]|uniref:pentatricopeptide repeat-containing protein At4g21065 n=1 Tax=Andrographis paniculata TaxID=175694 RepID=UPI0021E90EE3|nr:pentatricopeptide repeat-containing protein At4g21065 [Andrographis paniculata]
MHRFVSLRGCRKLRTKTERRDLLINANKHLNDLIKMSRFEDARKVFDEMSERDEFTWNTMIAGHANSGNIIEAKKLFDEAPKRTAITWSSLLSGFCKIGSENKSLRLFYEMLLEGHKPSQFTLGSLLRLCSIKSLLSIGEQIHGYAVKASFDMDVFIVTGLIDVYAKCMRIVEAECLFGSMSGGRNHVTWTALIKGYSLNGDSVRAIQCFGEMRAEGIEANQYTFPAVLSASAAVSDLVVGMQTHTCIVHGGFSANVFVRSALVDMYAKCGDLSSAWKVIESMEFDDVISWNAMLVGCVRQGFPDKALSVFRTMHAKDMELDEFTFPSVLNSLTLLNDEDAGKNIHSLVIKSGFERYMLVNNALIDMYAKAGNFYCAFKSFDLGGEKDVISWTSLITGCAHGGFHEEALTLFCKMRVNGTYPDGVVSSSILSSCAELALLDLGQQVHANCIQSGFAKALSVSNSLMSLYARCGWLDNAKKVFESMETRNVISWTALIVGYAQNGEGLTSLRCYDEMIASGVRPDFITFIGLLFACSHAGLTERGRYYFDSMAQDYGITPGPHHYACMIDLFGRAGRMKETEHLFKEMDFKPDATVWKALLSACRMHGNISLAKRAAEAILELEPENSVPYVMLSNIFSANRKWDEAASVRLLMKSRGVRKEPGSSWVESNGKMHTFMSGDKSHPDAGGIYLKIDEIMASIKGAGYIPATDLALRDINEEGKEQDLAYHSEKLAVAFGLLKLPKAAPIRIYKNLRVCGDCHAAMKFISQVYQRHIVLRDCNCFHHFKEGNCSCGDYW